MRRSGMILVLVLLAVLALELLAMSALGFARVAQMGARTAYADVLLQTAAGDAAEQALAGIDAAAVRTRPVGAEWHVAVGAPPGLSATAVLHRLPHGLIVARTEVVHPRVGSATAAALGRLIEPASLLEAFPAVLSVAAPLPVEPPLVRSDAAPCTRAPALAPPVLPDFAHRSFADSLPLGSALAMSWNDMHRLADSDRIAVYGEPPAGLVALRGPAAIDSTLTAILVVDGDLTLESGADVRGLLVVRGTLHLSAAARVRGAARVGMLVDAGGSIQYERCAIDAALTAPALARVYRADARWRLPAF